MSVSRYAKVALFWGPLGLASMALAADEVQPGLEFLEYLGSWEESDEEWLLFSDEQDPALVVDGDQQNESTLPDDEPTESGDET
jgi:hypothetical protein